jgi:ribose transport system ATP-binding protein
MIELRGVCKAFGRVPVLREVSLTLAPGRTLGLVGGNGAGKSTLMNVIGGNVSPDAGEMRLGGEAYAPRDAREAERRGVAFVHQELNLFPNLTIAENLLLGRLPRRRGLPLVDRRVLRERAATWLDAVGLRVAPDTPLERLAAGEAQLVEIARALGLEARLVILDEPTSSLSARETRTLFDLLGRLRGRGVSLVYISHVLEDVLRLCDDVAVLRDGAVQACGPRAGFDEARLISLMAGRSLGQRFPPRTAAPRDEVLLDVQSVSQAGALRNVSLQLHAGEVLGIAGLMGSGRTELARILFGLDPCERGRLLLRGLPLHGQPARARIERGMAFVSENRREEGLFLGASIADNVALVALERHASGPLRLLDIARLRRAVREIREAVRLTPGALDEQPAGTLSGGNQQKLVLARWLLARPDVLILDEPTRGIDVAARYDIYELVRALAAAGAGVLLISSETDELLGLCDRILVMCRGELRDELAREAFDRERILRAALPDSVAGSNPALAGRGATGES